MNFRLTDRILKYAGAVAGLLLCIAILKSLIKFPDDEKSLNHTISSPNPDAVISPAEKYSKSKNNIKNISTNNAIIIEAFLYDWQKVFDIFVYNKMDTSTDTLENLQMRLSVKEIINNPNRKFSRTGSDAILAEYGNIILEEAEYYKIDWRLIIAMIQQESAFSPEAISHAGAYGFMQIMPYTGSMLEKTLMLEDYRSPANNLRAGIYYFAMLIGRYYGAGDTNRIKLALAAYNSGAGRVEDAMTIAYYYGKNYLEWEIVREYLKLLGPENDSLHKEVWGTKPPSGYFTNWQEPYYYVENIIHYWQQYRKIYPLPQDNTVMDKKKKKRR